MRYRILRPAATRLRISLLLNPFPFPQPERLVAMLAWHSSNHSSGTGYREYLDWREENAVFEDMESLLA